MRIAILRSAVRTVACPYCLSIPGQKCKDVKGEFRAANHQQRLDKYKEKGHV